MNNGEEDQMNPPNIFDFATSELSQDAFICWLAAWAAPAFKETNEPLYATATAFLDRLLELSNVPKPTEYRSIEVSKQSKNIDVLLLVNDNIAIIIEDKTNTKDHSGQLQKYKATVAQEFPSHRVAAVYLKTGDQCDYENADLARYACFLRRDFLDILKKGEQLKIKSDIYADFTRYLHKIEQSVQGFLKIPPQKWEPHQWNGFFIVLKEKLGGGDWDKRGHGGGGSLTFRWHSSPEKYLGLHKGELGFRVMVTDEAQQKAKWNELSKMLLAKSDTNGIKIMPSRCKPGTRMKVAVLDGDYRMLQPDGLLDLDRTVETIRKAKALMDAALEVSITAAQIDAILPFLDRFEATDFSVGSWKTPEGTMPWFESSGAVSEFQHALYGNGWVTPSFDWCKWQDTAKEYVEKPTKIETADAATIQKLFTTHVRKERFCEGHLAAMFENGHVVALLRRLKAIQGATEATEEE